jgi:hypothetical protein
MFMYAQSVDMKNSNLKDFIQTNFRTNEDFIYVVAKAFRTIPLDCFGSVQYTLAHLVIARIEYLSKTKDSPIVWGILWDIATLFSTYSLINISREAAFKELLEYFEVIEPNQSELTPILIFSPPNSIPDTTLEYLRKVALDIGLYNTNDSYLFNTLKTYLL